MNVRYFSVAKDAYEAGDCPVCSRCGANMRHVTEIDGQMYGSGCGKIVLEQATKREKERKALIAEALKIMPSAQYVYAHWDIDQIRLRHMRCRMAGKDALAKAWQLIMQARSHC